MGMLHRAIAATAVSLLTLSAPASETVAPNTLLTERDNRATHAEDKNDKRAHFDANPTPIKLGVWHTLVLEVRGKSVLASVDGTVVAFGAHDAIDVDKASFAISVSGDSASFKDLRVWEATPNQDWETTRTRLRAGRPG